jgi:hypothetical protein
MELLDKARRDVAQEDEDNRFAQGSQPRSRISRKRAIK